MPTVSPGSAGTTIRCRRNRPASAVHLLIDALPAPRWDHDADAWSDAVDVDRAIRTGVRGIRGEVFLVPAVPVDEADLSTPADHGQLDLWANEAKVRACSAWHHRPVDPHGWQHQLAVYRFGRHMRGRGGRPSGRRQTMTTLAHP